MTLGMRFWSLWPLLLAMSSCGAIPEDQSGTLLRVREEGVVRVGVISGAEAPEKELLKALIDRSAAAAGGRPLVLEGAAEPLLVMLEAGEVDLVVGAFDKSSPWGTRVHLLPPLATEQRGGAKIETTAAARHGENRWIMLLEREARFLTEPK